MTTPDMTRTAVVAVSQNHAIGRDGWMPWDIPEDLKRFKALTSGKPMIMGRVTFESIGKPLPGRTSIVVTRDKNWSFDHERVIVCHDIESAISVADDIARRDGVNDVIIAGGAQIYRLALPYTTRYEITEIHATFEADTFLPPLPAAEWQEMRRENHQNAENGPDFSFVTLDKIA
ncbi:dihydrofolate reductase [Thalassospira profundimaris]|uniref:Dihydrofolate reductase n=1 Tax=Thalassospira profundimaris TaxID=502049 RepID=A0A367WFH8_9PROT|nr:dihydrofolate reductase [Thalassospira profundimaris]RCK39321.1 dihydrofolate reductase [Thalassospira profundimaris]